MHAKFGELHWWRYACQCSKESLSERQIIMIENVIRELGLVDAGARARLDHEAFGIALPGVPPTDLPAGAQDWGAVVEGNVVSRVVRRHFDSWFDGVRIPTAGIAGVATQIELRRNGLMQAVLVHVLRQATADGFVISTLFPSRPQIYRKFGYEVVGSLDTVRICWAASEPFNAPEPQLTIRAATEGDRSRMALLYDEWARCQTGPLTRQGPSFMDPPTGWPESSLVALALNGGGSLLGYVIWESASNHAEPRNPRIQELISRDAAATQSLLAVVASSGFSGSEIELPSSGNHLHLRTILPDEDWRLSRSATYMLRVLDLVRALEMRKYSTDADVALGFRVSDDLLAKNQGTYSLHVSNGRASCVRVSDSSRSCGGMHFGARGIGALFAGQMTVADLRRSGLATGPAGTDPVWDRLFVRPPLQIRDEF